MLSFLTSFALFVGYQTYIPPKEPIVVSVIDTGLDLKDPRFIPYLCKTGHKDFTGTGIEDRIGHGTHIASLIIQNAHRSDFCLLIIKFINKDEDEIAGGLSRHILYSNSKGADLVNISAGGDLFFESEKLAIELSQAHFMLAAGNDHKNIDKEPYFPASYRTKNSTIVGSIDNVGNISSFSNYGKNIHWEKGENVKGIRPKSGYAYYSGTSMATAIYTGKYLSTLPVKR